MAYNYTKLARERAAEISSKKSYSCKECSEDNLRYSYDRRLRSNKLVTIAGNSHADECIAQNTVKPAECHFCKRTDLFWLRRSSNRYSLVDSTNTKHTCDEYWQFTLDAREAYRMNYAFEKKRIKSIPDDKHCAYCKGLGHKSIKTRSKAMLQAGITKVVKKCGRCKGIGIFSSENKSKYLKSLRMRYWPFKGGTHKWKQYDGT